MKFWPPALFALALAGSFAWHFVNRAAHFQECDSDGGYAVLHGWPDAARVYTKLSSPPWYQRLRGAYIDAVEKANLPRPLRSAFAIAYGTTYSPGYGLAYGLIDRPELSCAEFVSRATILTLTLFHLSAFWLYLALRRAGPMVALVVGLWYLLSLSHYSYGYHLGSTVWHLATAALWLALVVHWGDAPEQWRKVGLLTGVLVFFNYLIVFYWTGYLVAAAWFSFSTRSVISSPARSVSEDSASEKAKSSLTLRAGEDKRQPTFAQGQLDATIKHLATTQWPAFTLIVACVVFFFQPGQGYRGSVLGGPDALPGTWAVVQNWFALTSNVGWADFAAGVVGSLALMWAFVWSARHAAWPRPGLLLACALGVVLVGTAGVTLAVVTGPNADAAALAKATTPAAVVAVLAVVLFLLRSTTAAPSFVARLTQAVFGLYFVAVIGELLGFTPARHLLFLSPLVYLAVGSSLQKLPTRPLIVAVFLLLVVGFIALVARRDAVERRLLPDDLLKQATAFLEWPPVDEEVSEPRFIGDASHRLIEELQGRGLKLLRHPSDLQPGQAVLYVSQLLPWDRRGEDTALPGRWVVLQKAAALASAEQPSETYFIAQNPLKNKHTRPNALFVTLFRLP